MPTEKIIQEKVETFAFIAKATGSQLTEEQPVAPPKPVLGYWKIRGLASNLRYQLAYQGIDYDMVEYE